MQDHEKGFWMLVVIGAFIGLGKLLASNEAITLRLALGRTILGSATAMVAAVMLIQFPSLPPVAMVGIGSALGIVGSQYLEIWIKRRMDAGGRSRGKGD